MLFSYMRVETEGKCHRNFPSDNDICFVEVDKKL